MTQRPSAKLWCQLLGLIGIAGLAACTPLQSFHDIRTDATISGRWLQIDGQDVYIEEQGSGEPVVLVHGYGGSTSLRSLAIPKGLRHVVTGCAVSR